MVLMNSNKGARKKSRVKNNNLNPTNRKAGIIPSYLTSDFKSDFAKAIDLHCSDLSHMSRKLLKEALDNPANTFFERMVDNGLVGDNYYIGLSDRYEGERNEDHLRALMNNRRYNEYQEYTAFFSNPLKFINEEKGEILPSDRLINTGLYYHSFETDETELNEQLNWLYGGHDQLSCVMGKIYCRLAKYKEFRGICVNYSGNKSLHIHTIWDLKHLNPNRFKEEPTSRIPVNEVPDELLWGVLPCHWNILNRIITNIIKKRTGKSVIFDIKMKSPTQYRRMPGGIRYADKDERFPQFTIVPQLELWSRYRNRPQKDKSSSYLHKPEHFFGKLNDKKKSSHKAPKQLSSGQPKEMEEFIECVKLITRACFGNYPEPMSASFDKKENIVINFRNSDYDYNASSVMVGDCDAIEIRGTKHDLENKVYSLPFSANDLWRKFKDVYLGSISSPAKLQNIINMARNRQDDFIINGKVILKKNELDLTQVANIGIFQERLLPELFTRDHISIVLAPEGSRKTTSLFRQIPYMENLKRGYIMVASASYNQAEAHRKTFNKMAKRDPRLKGYYGVILPSLSHLYEKFSATGQYKDPGTIYACGYSTLLEAIYDSEPDTAQKLENRKGRFWQKFPNKIPVFFTVHDVIQTWQNAMGTRTWAARDFAEKFKQRKQNKNWRKKLRKPKISHVIYDELKRIDLRTHASEEEITFVNKVLNQAGTKWSNRLLHSLYLRNKKDAPGSIGGFDDLLSIVRVKYTAANLVKVNSSIEQLGFNNSNESPYVFNDKPVYVKETSWWDKKLHYQLIILTTERSLFEILNSINEKANRQSGIKPFALYDLDSIIPLPKGTLDTELKTDNRIACNGKKIKDFAKDFFRQNPKDWSLISNGCMDEKTKKPIHHNIETHASARGKNIFIGRNVASTYTYPCPDYYAELLADGIYFNIKDAVKKGILDEFNQSVGRNLGFRHHQHCHSRVYMSGKFAGDSLALLFFLRKHSRYAIR